MPSLRREPIARSHRVAYTYVIMSRARETTRRPRAVSPSSARLRLARSRSRTWTSARRTRRHPPSRIPRRTWSSCSCAGGGGSRRAATAHPPRWRRATGRRGRRGLRFGFSVFFSRRFGKSIRSANRHVEGRRTRTVRDAGSGRRLRRTGRLGSGDARGNGTVGVVSFPSLHARDPEAFRAKRAGERAGGDGRRGALVFGDATHRQPWLARRS